MHLASSSSIWSYPIKCNTLWAIRKANSRGGNDNISIAYLKKESGES